MYLSQDVIQTKPLQFPFIIGVILGLIVIVSFIFIIEYAKISAFSIQRD